jgi:hypothetical protein
VGDAWSIYSIGHESMSNLFVRLVADGQCWFVLRKKVLLADCWWLVCSERKVLLVGG